MGNTTTLQYTAVLQYYTSKPVGMDSRECTEVGSRAVNFLSWGNVAVLSIDYLHLQGHESMRGASAKLGRSEYLLWGFLRVWFGPGGGDISNLEFTQDERLW